MDIVIVDFVSPNNLEFRELISQVQIFVKSERQFRILQLLTRELILLRRGFLPTFLPVQHPNAGAALSGHDVVTFVRSDLIRFEGASRTRKQVSAALRPRFEGSVPRPGLHCKPKSSLASSDKIF